MGFIFDSLLLELVVGAILLFWLFYRYMTSTYSYWKDRSIAYEEPSFPFGTDMYWISSKQPVGQYYQSVYTKYRKDKVVGMFQIRKPYLLIRDPELLKQIMTKDFHHFVDRGLGDPEIVAPLMKSLGTMQGEEWKTIRNKLSPAFTSGKMKTMFNLMEACMNEFVKTLEPLADQNEKISVRDYVACLTTDIIASCAFGLESNSIKNPGNEFRKNGNKIFQALSKLMALRFLITMAFPWLITKLHLVEPATNGSEDFFLKLVGDTVAYREKYKVIRNDFIDILIKIRNNKSLVDSESNDGCTEHHTDVENAEAGLTLEEMTAHAMLFFAAGFETTSTTLSFCLYEISLNPEIQAKMQKEIDEVLMKCNGKGSYQTLKDLSYMDSVINETLRRYSSLSILTRQCTEDYKLPGMDLVLRKGTNVTIPIQAVHHDPMYYPDPYRFDPDRFTDNKVNTKNNYTFLPFGEGPRMCIGNRFASMQMKMFLTMLLQKYELAITDDTVIPLKISNNHFITTPASPIILKISKRKQ